MGHITVCRMRDMLRRDAGATGVEYALMLAGIAMVVLLGVTAFGFAVRGLFERVPPL